MTTTNVPMPPPPPEPDRGGGRRSRSFRIAVFAFAVIVGALAFTEWGRETLLPFLFGLAIIFGIPAFVGAIRGAGRPPGERRRRFASGFFLALGIEVVLVVVAIGICVATYSSGGGG